MVSKLFENIYCRTTELLPPTVGAQLDMLRPSLRASWGGPLNGQRRRAQIVRDVNRVVEFDRVIETGTYRGTTTEFFSAVFGVPVSTVESSPRYYHYSRTRLRDQREITVTFGDSRSFLRDLCRAGEAAGATVFIYLDAHWKDDLPLREELEIIGTGWTRAVVMVDDFQVPGDPGYTFDDYGPGKALTAGYLPEMAGWEVFYPAAPSAKETGMCRGCVVLASAALGPAVTDVPSLTSPRPQGVPRMWKGAADVGRAS